MDISQDIKDLARLKQIISVLTKSGFASQLASTQLKTHLPLLSRFAPTPLTPKDQAKNLKTAFIELGPTFVKLGQLLSVRPDLVPEEYCEEFKSLQDNVPPFPFEQVQQIIEAELKSPLSKIFKSFTKVPLASASIAQVHRAVLRDGTLVAVKVQRPNIEGIINTDLDILLTIAHQLESHIEKIKPYRPVEIAKEFALWTRRELNFTREAASAIHLQNILKDVPKVRTPKMYLEYTTKRVLTMEYIDGKRLDDQSNFKTHSRHDIIMRYFTSILTQALGGGFFHADPHPANIFIDKRGNLIFLDFGIMGELNEEDRIKIISFITSINGANTNHSINIIISLARNTTHADLEQFKDESLPLLRDAYVHTIAENSAGKILYQILKLGAQHGLIFDPNHILMAKAMYQTEGIAIKLDPSFKIASGLSTFADTYLKKMYSPRKILERATKKLTDNRELLLELPDHIIKIMNRLEHQNDNQITRQELLEHDDKLYHNLKQSMMIALILILGFAASIMIYLGGTTQILSIPLTYLFLAIALIILIWYTVRN